MLKKKKKGRLWQGEDASNDMSNAFGRDRKRPVHTGGTQKAVNVARTWPDTYSFTYPVSKDEKG